MSKGTGIKGAVRWMFSILFLAGALTALGLYFFGGPGAPAAGLSDYAAKAIAGSAGTPVLLDAGSNSKIAVSGLEDGGIGGAAFLKVPFVDRYILTSTGYQGPSSFRKLVLRVDNGADRFFVSSDGISLSQGKLVPWAGSYTRFVLWAALAFLGWAALMTLGALVRRRQAP